MHSITGNKIVFGIFLAFFIVAGIGGVFAAEMAGGGAADCSYIGMPALCAMSPLQHLSEWQQTFAAVVQQTSTFVFLLLALCAAALLSARSRQLGLEPRASRAYRYYSPPLVSRDKKVTRWLSLFELSPSQA